MECTLYNFSAFQYVYICKNIKDFISSLSSAFIKLKPCLNYENDQPFKSTTFLGSLNHDSVFSTATLSAKGWNNWGYYYCQGYCPMSVKQPKNMATNGIPLVFISFFSLVANWILETDYISVDLYFFNCNTVFHDADLYINHQSSKFFRLP